MENKKFNPIYLTQEELDAIQQQFQEEQELSSRASDISTYLLNVDSTTIADIENSILEIEKNKVIKWRNLNDKDARIIRKNTK